MFRQPLVYLVPSAAAALFCAVCLDFSCSLHSALLLLALSLAAAGAAVYHEKLFAVFGMLAAAAFAFSCFGVYNMLVVSPVRELVNRNAEISAEVLHDAAVYDDSQRAELLLDAGTVLPRSFRTLCYLPLTEEPLRAGDRITANVGFYLSGAAEGFDRAAYQASDGVYIASSYNKRKDGTPISFSVISTNNQSLRYLPDRIARGCKQTIETALPKRQSGLLTALLLGNKSALDTEDALSLRIAGLSHLVAVSGLHVGFLVSFCFLLLGRRIGTFFSIPLVLLFVPIAGATPSVVRAAMMYLLAAGAFCLRKEASSLNSLFLALAILLFQNPYAIASLSLQLSFSATLGLILFSSRMQRGLMRPFARLPHFGKKAVSVFAGALSCSVCAMIFTAPILLSSFGSVSVLALLSNLLVVGAAGLCFVGGLLLCLGAACMPVIVPLLSQILRPLLSYMLAVADKISALPFGLVNWTDRFGVAALVVCFAAILLWLFVGSRVRWRYVLPCVFLLLAGLTAGGMHYDKTHYTVTYLPCGTGQAVIVSDSDRHMTLIDCGGDGGYRNAAASVQEWMRWHNFKRIDTLILTAVDKGHARDLPELLMETDVDRILIPNGCKETKHNKEIVSLVQSAGALVVGEKRVLQDGAAPITVFPVTAGKLGILIADRVLILHSPTQKQLAEFFDGADYSADELVLSQNNVQDLDLLRQTLEHTRAEHIILQAGSKDAMEQIDDISVESPYFSGELQKEYAKE